MTHFLGSFNTAPSLKLEEAIPWKNAESIINAPGGLLIFNGRVLLHGNTPVKLEAGGNRVSFVAYTQQILTDCTTCKTSMSEAKPE